MTNIEQFLQMVKESDNIVFFGGAGVSTESGIPDFRSVDGLYNQKYDYPPETILSHSFYIKYPEEFYRFYRDKMLCLTAEPNITHKKLAELEAAGKVKAVVTQNIDGLHQLAGSKRVLELHGSVHRNYCRKCGKGFDAEYVRDYPGKVPLCDACGGTIKPDVVLYDVLGDVVCGGFTMPMRSGYADAVYILTSGENMAIHAAANIASAVERFQGRGYAKLGGFLLNRRNVKREEEKVEAEDFHSRILYRLPHCDLVPEAEEQGKTVLEAYPDSQMAEEYRALARVLMQELEDTSC